jgi:POT family proton-dependent oligopeptide transporter
MGARRSCGWYVGTPAVPTDLHTGGLGGHPRGLTTLFLAEMWERFSSMACAPADALHGADRRRGRARLRHQGAAAIYGTYTMSVYLLCILGGFLADNFIGARRAVLVGGIIIAPATSRWPCNSELTFYIGLVLIAAGTGLLKPNISTMVGSLYRPDRRTPRRRLLDLLHGHQPRRLPRPARHRLPRPERGLEGPLTGWGLDPRAAAGTGASPPPASA